MRTTTKKTTFDHLLNLGLTPCKIENSADTALSNRVKLVIIVGYDSGLTYVWTPGRSKGGLFSKGVLQLTFYFWPLGAVNR